MCPPKGFESYHFHRQETVAGLETAVGDGLKTVPYQQTVPYQRLPMSIRRRSRVQSPLTNEEDLRCECSVEQWHC